MSSGIFVIAFVICFNMSSTRSFLTFLVMWQATLWDFLKSTPKYKPLLKKDLTWTTDEATNRGFISDAGTENPKLTAAEKSDLLDSILLRKQKA